MQPPELDTLRGKMGQSGSLREMSKPSECPTSDPTGDGEGKLPPHPDQQTTLPRSPRRPKVLGGRRAVGPARPWLRQVPAFPGARPRGHGAS